MFLKKAAKTAMTDDASTRAVVEKLLKQIEEHFQTSRRKRLSFATTRMVFYALASHGTELIRQSSGRFLNGSS